VLNIDVCGLKYVLPKLVGTLRQFFCNVACSIVILLAFVLQEVLYISCSCLRAWNICCLGFVGAFVDGVTVGDVVWCIANETGNVDIYDARISRSTF
jgi:hypothetical protein